MVTHLSSLISEAESSWKGTASSTYQDVQERLNDALQRSRSTLTMISEALVSSSKDYAQQEGASAQNLNLNLGEDKFTDGRGEQHIVKEAGDKTTVECDPGKNCPEDLEKKLEQQQQLDHKQDKESFFDKLPRDVLGGAIVGGAGGAAMGGILGSMAGGVGAVPGAIAGAETGAVGGAITALGKDIYDELAK